MNWGDVIKEFIKKDLITIALVIIMFVFGYEILQTSKDLIGQILSIVFFIIGFSLVIYSYFDHRSSEHIKRIEGHYETLIKSYNTSLRRSETTNKVIETENRKQVKSIIQSGYKQLDRNSETDIS